MDDIERIRQEIIESGRRLANDSKYQNEEYPARMFRDHAEEYLGIKIQDLRDNHPNDPPDFFIQANGQPINLEITALGNEWVFEKNSFFKKVESIARPIIDKHFCLLPDGFFYSVYYLPGSMVDTNIPDVKISVTDFGFQINQSELEKQLLIKIPEEFKKFNPNQEINIPLINHRGNHAGEIKITAYANAQKGYILQPLVMRRKQWTRSEFTADAQRTIDQKDKKYCNNKKISRMNANTWWLLISDIHNAMCTGTIKFQIQSGDIRSKFFSRIFLINSTISQYRIREL